MAVTSYDIDGSVRFIPSLQNLELSILNDLISTVLEHSVKTIRSYFVISLRK